MEQWRDIEGFDGKYQVSSFGRIRSTNFHRSKQCKIMKTTKTLGYLGVGLTKKGKGKIYFIHRLVAKAFINNPNNKPFVNHKDGDKYNNNVENLEWVTPSENCIHRLYELKVLNFPYPPKPIICVETGEKFASINMAAKKNKLDQGTLSKAVNSGGKRTAGGFHWVFLKQS